MNLDSIELSLSGPAVTRRKRAHYAARSRAISDSVKSGLPHTPTVVDAAFEVFFDGEERLSRVDAAVTNDVSSGEYSSTTDRGLFQELVEQLKALDHQRKQLGDLLRRIDNTQLAD